MECGVLPSPPHVFLMVDRRASALYELEQIFLNGCELSTTRAAPSELWETATIGSVAFLKRVSTITRPSTSLKL